MTLLSLPQLELTLDLLRAEAARTEHLIDQELRGWSSPRVDPVRYAEPIAVSRAAIDAHQRHLAAVHKAITVYTHILDQHDGETYVQVISAESEPPPYADNATP